MTNYRKFMEPEYGEPAPEVIIYPSQEMDMEHLARWRKKNDYESVAEITEEIRHCICYPNLMKIDTEDVKILGPQGNVNTRIYKPEGGRTISSSDLLPWRKFFDEQYRSI